MIIVTSENLIKDLAFKQKVGVKAESADEALAIIDEAFLIRKMHSEESGQEDDASDLLIGPFRDRFQPEDVNSDVQVNVKLFLATDCPDTAIDAVQKMLHLMGLKCIRSLIVTVPLESIPHIGIGRDDSPPPEGDVDPAESQFVDRMIRLWEVLTQEFVVKRGIVEKMGLCDLETRVFKTLYNEAKVKPSSIQVNFKVCCAVPDDLQDFAKKNGVQLHTHVDSANILGPEFNAKLPRLRHSPVSGQPLRSVWLIKVRSFITSRGVLCDKRYLVALAPDTS